MAKISTRPARSLGLPLCIAGALLTAGAWAQSPAETRTEPSAAPSTAPGADGQVPGPQGLQGGPMMAPGYAPMMPPGMPPGMPGPVGAVPPGQAPGWHHHGPHGYFDGRMGGGFPGHPGWHGGPGYPAHGPMRGPNWGPNWGPFMAHLDTDGDGAVSRGELEAAHQRHMALFEQADTDRDGKLTRDEMRAFHGHQWQERRSQRRSEPRAPRDPALPPALGAEPVR